MPSTTVKATRPGFYGKMRAVGEVFDIADDSLLGSWMDPVKDEDQKRLAERMKALAGVRRKVLVPGKDVPITTALIKSGPPEPKAPAVAEKPAKAEKPAAGDKT